MHATQEQKGKRIDLAIVGGGIAGLAAAALAARAGKSVVLLEKSGRLGGRAATDEHHGALFNLGPHALYCHGRFFQLLKSLGAPISGGYPVQTGAKLFLGNEAHPFPNKPLELLSSRLLTLGEKWRLSRFFQTMATLDPIQFERISVGEWVQKTAGDGNLAMLLHTLVRLSTFVNEPKRLSAGAAIRQLQIGLAGNVWYLDGGWQSAVDGLRALATSKGASIRASHRVEGVDSTDAGVFVRLADQETIFARSAILAVGPQAAAKMLALPEESPLVCWSKEVVGAKVSCLDVALASLPQPGRTFALGLDRPLYYSVHSASAKLAADGVAVVHVMKYLGEDSSATSKEVEMELEAFLDQQQPDWRSRVVARRSLPSMLASSCAPTVASGLAGRPTTAIDERPGVFLAGDWIGSEGMLSDASAASAEQAVAAVLRWIDGAPSRNSRSLAHV